MIDYKNVQVVLIGYHKTIPQYGVNLALYRKLLGNDVWITTVYGESKTGVNQILSGCGENAFISVEDTGYAFGALDAINAGLQYALTVPRDIILLHNFDVLIFTREGYDHLIRDFIESGKDISAAEDANGLLATDCMIYKKELLWGLLPIKPEHDQCRESLEIAERYKSTQLGFHNVEEWFWNALQKCYEMPAIGGFLRDEAVRKILKEHWHCMDRTDLPRLRWSERLTLGHLHEANEIIEKLAKYGHNKGE